MATLEDGQLIYVSGRSRSGKSAWVKQQIKKLMKKIKRVIVFDIKAEYSEAMGYKVVTSLSELASICKKTKGPLMIAYQPSDPKNDFGMWANIAFTWCMMKPCIIVAEELAMVSTPAKAPQGWFRVCSQVLGLGGWVFAICQRPMEADKTAIGNASVIHCCQLNRKADRKYMAEELDVDVSEIANLEANADTGVFTFIERNMSNRELTRGRLKFG